MPELEKKGQEQEKNIDNPAKSERKSGSLFWVALLIGLVLMLIGSGTFQALFSGDAFKSQLMDIYSVAMTLCLSCIGLGQIKFGTLLDLAIIFAVFIIVYKLLEVKNVKKQ